MSTDIDIINDFREALGFRKTKRVEVVADLIDQILNKDFKKTDSDPKYSNAIFKIKEYISNINYKCKLKYTHRVLIVDNVLNELDGGI